MTTQESQNHLGWRGSVEIIQSAFPQTPAQAQSPRAGCPGPCPDRYINLILFKFLILVY